MRTRSLAAAVTFGFLMLLTSNPLGPALAAETEIKVLSALAFRPALDELGPRFEKETGHKLAIEYDVVGALKRKVEGGAQFDVAIITPQFIEDLAKQGKIAAGTQVNIARSGIGVLVRTGAAKPDIKSADAFKRAMLAAKSIGYAREGATSMHMETVFQRLGIADDMKAKVKHTTGGGRGAAEALTRGETELGLIVISAIEPTPGVELLGPLPGELQHYVAYAGGVSAQAKEAKAGKALIDFLRAPAAVPVLKTKGLEPTL